MRILLDESVPRRLGPMLPSHEAATVAKMGWAVASGTDDYLHLPATKFDVLLTADRNIEYQQNLSTLPLSILVLVTRSNRLEVVEPLVPDILKALNHLPPRTLRRVGG